MIAIRPKSESRNTLLSVLARNPLQRQGDEITEAALWHRVLVREEAVVGVHPELVAPVHGSGEDQTAEFSRGCRRDGTLEEIQMCPPLPERDRSSGADTPSSRHVSRNAATSSCQLFLSKSTARNQQVSSRSNGYTPIVCLPSKCCRTTSSVRGRSVPGLFVHLLPEGRVGRQDRLPIAHRGRT